MITGSLTASPPERPWTERQTGNGEENQGGNRTLPFDRHGIYRLSVKERNLEQFHGVRLLNYSWR